MNRESRGGGWVVAQFVLFGLIFLSLFFGDGVTPLGWIVAAAGLALGIWAGRTMGDSLSAYPRPPHSSELVQTGPFRLIRHPIYVGGTLFFAGLGLVFSVYALALTGVLALLWVFKARYEERLLAERFPEYEDYRRRTVF
jgi:protein-S-isoprenylcysteine O-methyltransferase Ste14